MKKSLQRKSILHLGNSDQKSKAKRRKLELFPLGNLSNEQFSLAIQLNISPQILWYLTSYNKV